MEAYHHILEFFVVNASVVVLVELLHEVVPLLSVDLHFAAEGTAHRTLHHLDWNRPSALEVLFQVEQVERVAQVKVRDHDADFVSLVDEFLVLDVTVSIFVHLLDDFLQVLFQHGLDLHVLLELVDYSVDWQLAVALLIHFLENPQQLHGRTVRAYLVVDEALQGLFQFTLAVEEH